MVFDDEMRFMTQDTFVLHAADGDLTSVRRGLNEKVFCSVNGLHKDKVINHLKCSD